MTEEITNKADRILTNLEVIAGAKMDNKLTYDCANNINIDKSYMQSLSRFFNGYDRIGTLENLDRTYGDANDLIDEIVKNQKAGTFMTHNHKNVDLLHKLIFNLEKSVEGLNSLSNTYIDDIHITSRIKTLMKNIETQIQYAKNNIQLSIPIEPKPISKSESLLQSSKCHSQLPQSIQPTQSVQSVQSVQPAQPAQAQYYQSDQRLPPSLVDFMNRNPNQNNQNNQNNQSNQRKNKMQ